MTEHNPGTVGIHSNNRTGARGVSYKRTLRRSRRREERFFVAKFPGPDGRPVVREFSIDRLGRELAWEKALRCRAEYDRAARRRKEVA
jgi:hypothetical protein